MEVGFSCYYFVQHFSQVIPKPIVFFGLNYLSRIELMDILPLHVTDGLYILAIFTGTDFAEIKSESLVSAAFGAAPCVVEGVVDEELAIRIH